MNYRSTRGQLVSLEPRSQASAISMISDIVERPRGVLLQWPCDTRFFPEIWLRPRWAISITYRNALSTREYPQWERRSYSCGTLESRPPLSFLGYR